MQHTDSLPCNTSLRQSWAIQRRVIGALFMREVLTRYGRHNIGFLWLFIEPMIFTLAVAILWTLIRSSSQIPIIAFAVTGYSSVLLWRNMPARCIGAVEPNLALMYHRNVKIIDIYAARLLLEIGGVSMSFAFISILFASFGLMPWPEDIGKVLVGWLLLCWFGVSLGLFLGALSERSEAVSKIWTPISYITFPLSGAAFLIDALPAQAQKIILWFPMVHGVELLREGFFGSAFRARYDIGYMAMVCMGLSILGLANLRSLGRTVLPK